LQGLLRLAEARTKRSVETRSVPLHAVLRRVVENHRLANPHRHMFLSGETPIFARANSLWVEIAIANLLSNAEKHTPKDQEIGITFHENGNRATIVVADNGAGLREELYSSLWDIYYRGPNRDVVVSGSGIGLALCKELIETMGGQVWAGPSPKHGSVFAISLPALWDNEPDTPAVAAPTSASDAAFIRVPFGTGP
jgi:signal transduction histidine kinase